MTKFFAKLTVLIFILSTLVITNESCSQVMEALNCDSANVIFKNITTDTIKFVHAVIKGQEVGFYNLKPGQESPMFKVDLKGQNIFRFSVYKDDLDNKLSIEPMDYFDQVSKEEIICGTYIYYIGCSEEALDVQLKKVN